LLAILSMPIGARADQIIRMAGIAPDGASWTRELKAFARDIEVRTQGRVKLKWYWGGIAGDELQVLDRIQRGQLDGEAGAQVCERLAPSLGVLRVLGLFQNRDESAYVIGRMRGLLDGEFRSNGFMGIASGMGNDLLFSRTPIRTMAELRKSRPWVWDLDKIMTGQLKALGMNPVLLPLNDATQAYEDGRSDGFLSIPTAALAFQWSAHTKYFTDFPIAFLPGCLVITNRVFDALPIEDQHAIRDAAGKLFVRFEDLGRTQDKKLLDELFEKQGLQRISVGETFRSEFFSATREVREHLPVDLVSHELLSKVLAWLADYRAEKH
jgi:TRAP-type C4-dicarboxylate transport system substrate-binding protein